MSGPAVRHPLLGRVIELLERLEDANHGALDAAADLVLATLKDGGVVHVGGSGHSTLFALEAFYRAGGLACINPIWHPALLPLSGGQISTLAERTNGLGAALVRRAGIRDGEVMVVFSQSGVNPVPVELAEAARAAGASVVAVVSRVHSDSVASRHRQGRRLGDLANVVIDTGVPLGDADYVAAPGAPPVVPLSTLAGVYAWNAVLARVADRAAASGVSLPVWRSANAPGGDATAARLIERYAERIHAL